jgi:hypothetical protein
MLNAAATVMAIGLGRGKRLILRGVVGRVWSAYDRME